VAQEAVVEMGWDGAGLDSVVLFGGFEAHGASAQISQK